MSYQTDDPSLSWFVIPTKENYYTTYTEWLEKQNCSEELILRFEKTSMKLDRTVTIKNLDRTFTIKNKVFKVFGSSAEFSRRYKAVVIIRRLIWKCSVGK